jgi:glycosyltransferase involved in cell wall biosynthesis
MIPRERLRLVFVGRVSRMKNLGFALDVLRRAGAPVDFDIYGPLAEHAAVADVERAMTALPPQIRVTLKGAVAKADVPRVLAAADLFFMPTLGENFGHAIFEALSCGVPALVSDRTPWRGLEVRQAGWDLPLDQPQAFVDAIRQFAGMTPDERHTLKHGARTLAGRYVADTRAEDAIRRMFTAILADSKAETPTESASTAVSAVR